MTLVTGRNVEMIAEFVCHHILPSEQRRKALHLDKSGFETFSAINDSKVQCQKMRMLGFIGHIQISRYRALCKFFEIRTDDKINDFVSGGNKLFFKLPAYENGRFGNAKRDLVIINFVQVGEKSFVFALRKIPVIRRSYFFNHESTAFILPSNAIFRNPGMTVLCVSFILSGSFRYCSI